jgi:hypothetical protein
VNSVHTTDGAPTGAGLDALTVVMPVYNEERWVRTAVEAVLADLEAAGLAPDVVLVDDGSTDGTPEVLAELARTSGVRVISQSNAGRVAARAAGLAAAASPWVLLLDSRVVVEPGALGWVRRQIAAHPDREVWCGHVDVETRENPYAAYWSGLVKVGWRRYTGNPRLVSFGAEDFDLYPKGTGCLLIRRELLEDSMGGFESLYDAVELASDDTRLLRHVAGTTPIWLSPDFRFRYHGKSGLRGFVRQSYFRGTTFVDGYLGQAGTVRRALLGVLAAGAVVGGVALRHPKVGAAGAAAVLVGVPAVVRASGGSPGEVRSAATLTPLFAPVFGAGVLRGLALAAAKALRVPSGPAE